MSNISIKKDLRQDFLHLENLTRKNRKILKLNSKI